MHAERAEAYGNGITAVPTFVIEGEWMLQGAHETEKWVKALTHISEELATREPDRSDPAQPVDVRTAGSRLREPSAREHGWGVRSVAAGRVRTKRAPSALGVEDEGAAVGSAMSRAMARPRPVPPTSADRAPSTRAKRSKMRSRSACGDARAVVLRP